MKNLLRASVCIAASIFPIAISGQTTVPATSVINYGCRGLRDQAPSRYYGDTDEMSWEIEYNDGNLTVTWVGLWANCCLNGFESSYVVDGANVRFSISEVNEDDLLCDCICDFDVATTFAGFEPGHYIFSIAGTDVAAEVDVEDGCHIMLKSSQASVATVNMPSDLISISGDILHIGTHEAAIVDIYDAKGMLCTHLKTDGSSDVSLSGLPKGIYTTRVTVYSKVSVLRFAR